MKRLTAEYSPTTIYLVSCSPLYNLRDANIACKVAPRRNAGHLAAEHDNSTPRQSLGTRELPKRSARNHLSYANPYQAKKGRKQTAANVRKSKNLLTSDTTPAFASKNLVETSRNIIRHDIAAVTKTKRDRFILTNKEYFQPLLPDNSYISKLEHRYAANGNDDAAEVVTVTSIHQPSGVKATMKPYQLEGLTFLARMHENGMPAILGDEMGLGKTLQTLSLFQYLKDSHQQSGEIRPHLVVCPLSVLSSWMAECKRWVPGLNVVRFHGPPVERTRFKRECLEKRQRSTGTNKSPLTQSADYEDRIDVVVTTYDTFVSEQNWFKRAFVWRYCVLDEGHKVKNDKTEISTALQGLGAEYRLLLTGTPLQNNLHEMWSLLHWLLPEVFPADTAGAFKKAFDLTQGTVSTKFLDDARRLLELLMLRRMKSSSGVDLNLPPKEEVLLFVPLTPMQRFWYTRLLTRVDKNTLDDVFTDAKHKELETFKKEIKEEELADIQQGEANMHNTVHNSEAADMIDVWAASKAIMEEALKGEQVEQGEHKKNDWKKLMNLVMQLRKACNHPYLLPNAAPDEYEIGEHVKTASGKFIVLDKLLDELVLKKNKKVLIFSGFTRTLNLCEELLALKGANGYRGAFRVARLDGGTNRAQRNLSIRMFNDPISEYRVMLLSTRAGGLGINLTAATEVVFMDEDWNPQVTIQAEARAHRIGQNKKVTIYKLCTQGTVEEQMMGRIRKKLYLSAKITEGMRNIHSAIHSNKKRKRIQNVDVIEDETPQLDTASLQSIIRRGTQTLTRPEIDVTEMLSWDWETTLEKCKEKPIDDLVRQQTGGLEEADEEKWLSSMERVECAVFEGKKHQKEIDQRVKTQENLTRADRREGKNTTVMIDGFAINKESLQCADWEAVPTMAGKDPRLAEPKREKKAVIQPQQFCQCCWDGGQVVLCNGCPRTYHLKCLDKTFQKKAGGMAFYCPQHQCRDCDAKTTEAGGLIYRCRWCEHGFCEDCLEWETIKLVGDSLPEFEMLGFSRNNQAYYIECRHCIEHWEHNPADAQFVEKERVRIQRDYELFLEQLGVSYSSSYATPNTVSEVGTPLDERPPLLRPMKKPRLS